MPTTITVPPAFAGLVREREGAPGADWVERLPALVDDLLIRFGCVVDGPLTHGGVGLVIPVRRNRDDRAAAVLKVSVPHHGNVGEAAALRLLAGRAAVRLLDADEARDALLLERIGPDSLDDAGLPPEAMIEIAGSVARRIAGCVPETVDRDGLTALADTTAGWLGQLDEQVAATPGALPAGAIDRARSTITVLGTERTATLLHGDLHGGNLLAADREPWLAVDPKGWTGTPAYDGFTVVAAARETLRRHPDLAAELDRRIVRFAAAAGVDAGLARDCVQARAVSSLLHGLAHPEGDWFDHELLRVAAGGTD